MNTDNKYGYKVCYKEYGKTRLKIYLVTNTLDGAIWSVRWYKRDPPIKVNNPQWKIFEVKTLNEYEKLWKGCPFKDDLT